jgi:hypothetical protein
MRADLESRMAATSMVSSVLALLALLFVISGVVLGLGPIAGASSGAPISQDESR